MGAVAGFSSVRPRTGPWVFVAIAVWVLALGAGFALLLRYKNTPSAADGTVPAAWPTESRLARGPRFTLVMFGHPECPCTRASISELARLLPRLGHGVAAHVVVVSPEGAPANWKDAEIWDRAALIPGVTVASDDGREAALFNAGTSGLTVLYGPQGTRLFAGGITASRGHEGDSFGQQRILSLVKTGTADRADSPVFGCALARTRTAPEHAHHHGSS